MKLYHIRKENGFNQQTFYNWLKETGLIEKGPKGYITGPNAWDEMAVLTTKRVDVNGEVREVTQVTVPKNKVSALITAYLSSGKTDLYTQGKRDEIQLKFQIIQDCLEKIEQQLTQLMLK